MEKEIRNIDERGKQNVTTRSWNIKFIDSTRFMARLLSNLVDNLAEEIHQV